MSSVSLPLLHFDSSETVLNHVSRFHGSNFTPAQAMADLAVSSFLGGVTDVRTLTALTAGGYAYRLGRLGVLSLGAESASGSVLPLLLRGGSYLVGFAGESVVFAGVNRGFSSLEDQNPTHSFLHDWAQAAITLAPLKIVPSIFQNQNLVLQHLVTDGAVVAGNQLASRFHLGEKPHEDLLTQLFHAEALNWQMKGVMALAQATAPKIFALERGLDLSIGVKEGGLRNLPRVFPPYALATVGTPSGGPRIFEEGRFQAEGLYSKMSSSGDGNDSKKIDLTLSESTLEDGDEVIEFKIPEGTLGNRIPAERREPEYGNIKGYPIEPVRRENPFESTLYFSFHIAAGKYQVEASKEIGAFHILRSGSKGWKFLMKGFISQGDIIALGDPVDRRLNPQYPQVYRVELREGLEKVPFALIKLNAGNLEKLFSKLSGERVGEIGSIFDQITNIRKSKASLHEQVKALTELGKDRDLHHPELEILIDVIGAIGDFEEKLIPLGELGSSEKRSTKQLQFLIKEIKNWYASHVHEGGAMFLSHPIHLLTKNPNLSDEQLEDLVQFSLDSQQVPDAKVVTLEAISIHSNLPGDLFIYIAEQMQKLNPKYFVASFLDGKHPYANHPGWVAYREKISKNESDENPKPGLGEGKVTDSTLVSIAREISQRASTSEKDAGRCEKEGYSISAGVYRRQAERLRLDAERVFGLTQTEFQFEKEKFLAQGPGIKASAEAYFQKDSTSGVIQSFEAEGYQVKAGINEDQVEFKIVTPLRKKAQTLFRIFIKQYEKEGSARRALEWLVREHTEVTLN